MTMVQIRQHYDALLVAFALVQIACCPSVSPHAKTVPTGDHSAPGRGSDSPRGAVTHRGTLRLLLQQLEGDRAHIKLTLSNDSEQAVWVNGRMHLDSERSPFKEVWFDVVHARTGKRVFFDCKTGSTWAGSHNYLYLSPARSFSSLATLRCFTFHDAGPWLITAHYRDGNMQAPPAPAMAVHWTKELTSNTIQVEVEPSPKRRRK